MSSLFNQKKAVQKSMAEYGTSMYMLNAVGARIEQYPLLTVGDFCNVF